MQSRWSFFKKPLSFLKDCAIQLASLEALTYFTGNPMYSGLLLLAWNVRGVDAINERIGVSAWKGTVGTTTFKFLKSGEYVVNTIQQKILEFTISGQEDGGKHVPLTANKNDIYINGTTSLTHLQPYNRFSITTPIEQAQAVITHFWDFDFTLFGGQRNTVSMNEIPTSPCQFEFENDLVRIHYNFSSRLDLCTDFQSMMEDLVERHTPSSFSIGWGVCLYIATAALGGIIAYGLYVRMTKESPTILKRVGDLETEIQRNIIQYMKLNASDANKYEHAFNRLKERHKAFLLACNIAGDKQVCPITQNQFIEDPVHTVLKEKKKEHDVLSNQAYERTALFQFARRYAHGRTTDMMQRVPIRQIPPEGCFDPSMPMTKAVTISNPVRVRVGDEKSAHVTEPIFSHDAVKVGSTHPLGKGRVVSVEKVDEPIYLREELAKFIPGYVKQLKLLNEMIQEVLQKAISESQKMPTAVVIDPIPQTLRRRHGLM